MSAKRNIVDASRTLLARLRYLRDVVVPKIPANELNMANYEKAPTRYDHTCGTSRCIAGWAAVNQTFMDQGLRLHGKYTYGSRWPIYQPQTKIGQSRREKLGDRGSVLTESDFFGLTYNQWQMLFGPNSYRYDNGHVNNTPGVGEIQTRINKVIKRNHGVNR